MKLAVNQNGRWAPHLAWLRGAVASGLIGEVTGLRVAIRWNHGWISGTPFEAVDDLVLWDFGIHWFDFLVSVIGDRALRVHATTARAAGQTVRPPLLAQALVSFPGGQASLIFDGDTRYGPQDSTVVIGARGRFPAAGRTSASNRSNCRPKPASRGALEGSWFNDGFAGAMGELLCAIEEDREPLNSARGNLASIRLCQAAVRSSRTGRRFRCDGAVGMIQEFCRIEDEKGESFERSSWAGDNPERPRRDPQNPRRLIPGLKLTHLGQLSGAVWPLKKATSAIAESLVFLPLLSSGAISKLARRVCQVASARVEEIPLDTVTGAGGLRATCESTGFCAWR